MRIRTLFVVVIVLALVVAACGGSAPLAPTSTAESPTTVAPSGVTTTVAPEPATTLQPPSTATTTTVGPSDTTPPALRISLPGSGERVDHRWCPFAGTTEPGVTLLAAGRYPVEVAADGSWSTVLSLNPGGNVATFTATDAAGNITEQQVAVYYDPPLVLRADGLGDFDFFEEMDVVMAGLTDLLGPPVSDREVTPENVEFDVDVLFGIVAYPAVGYFRTVHWPSLGLEVMFSDYEPADWPFAAGPVVFNGWIVRDPGDYGSHLYTAAGATVGTSLTELDAMYGEALRWYPDADELTGDWHFLIDSGMPSWDEDGSFDWYGRFDGDPIRPPTHVAQLQAGFGYDEC